MYTITGIVLLVARRPSAQVMIVAAGLPMSWAVVTDPVPEFRSVLLIASAVLPMAGAAAGRRWWPTALAFMPVMVLVEIFGSDLPPTIRAIELVAVMAMMWLGYWLVAKLSSIAGENQARGDQLFDRSPVPTWELDYSQVVRRLGRLRGSGPTDIDGYLQADTVAELARSIEVKRANPAAERLFGRPEPTMIGRYHGDFGVQEALTVREEVLAVWDGLDDLQREFETTSGAGEAMWVRQEWAPTRLGDTFDYGSVIVANADVTTQKSEATRLVHQVRQKDEFIAAVSHELRTPLAVVVGLSHELCDAPLEFDSSEAQELLEMIASQSMDVANIVEDLLVAARIDTGNISVLSEPMDVGAGLHGLAAGWPLHLSEEQLVAFADPYRFRQIIRNLLVNADRYGGADVRISAEREGSEIVVEVRADGPGIPKDMVDGVFEAYGGSAAGRQERMSVGLGLTFSRELAQLMNRALDYRRHGQDTVFRLRLPVAAGDEAGAGNSLDRPTDSRIG